jgi:hypothetical protein
MTLTLACIAAACSPGHEPTGNTVAGPKNAPEPSLSPTRSGDTEHIDKGRTIILAKLPTADGGDGAILLGTLYVAQQCVYVTNTKGDNFLIAITTDAAKWENSALEVTLPNGKTERFQDGDPVQLGGSSASSNVRNVLNQLIVKPWPDCDQNRVWVTSMVARGE